jgi:hypothetical protein
MTTGQKQPKQKRVTPIQKLPSSAHHNNPSTPFHQYLIIDLIEREAAWKIH